MAQPLAVLALAAAPCNCIGTADVGGGGADPTDLPGIFKIAAAEPHYADETANTVRTGPQ